MDIQSKFRDRITQRQMAGDGRSGPGVDYGSAASEQNEFWWARAQSWAEGHGATAQAICDENDGEHARWGTPYQDVGLPTVANNGDEPLSNPHNYHSNPGYMGTTTLTASHMGNPGSMRYRTPGAGGASSAGHRPMPLGGRGREQTAGRTVLPASGARQPESEGGPLLVTTGTQR